MFTVVSLVNQTMATEENANPATANPATANTENTNQVNQMEENAKLKQKLAEQDAMINELVAAGANSKKRKKDINEDMKTLINTTIKEKVFKTIKFCTDDEQVKDFVDEVIDELGQDGHVRVIPRRSFQKESHFALLTRNMPLRSSTIIAITFNHKLKLKHLNT